MKTVGMLVLLLALPLISVAQDPGVLVVEPVILAGGPDAYDSARGVSPNLEISMLYQPDLNAAAVDAWRYVVVEAWLDDPGIWVASRYAYETYGTGLVDFENDGWSDWTDWDDPDATQRFTITGLDAETPDGARKYYLLALQVRDVTGAVSTELDYCVTVHHFFIDTGLVPELTVRESHLESAVFSGTHGMVHDDLAAGQELRFEWYGSADAYGGTIAGYRWGWDVSDLDDPDDPGWMVPFGTGPDHTATPVATFPSGIHVLTIECRDAATALTRAQYVLSVVPVPPMSQRRPLLLIDDVNDHASLGWFDEDDIPLDNDFYRDGFWEGVLAGVEGWDPDQDVVDAEEDQSWDYRDAVEYRSLVWSIRSHPHSYVDNRFVAPYGSDRYVWLEPFMEHVGNVFMVGSGAMTSFEPEGYQDFAWLHPVVLDTDELDTYDGAIYRRLALGEGVREEPDGTLVNLGTETFPYRGMGLSIVSHMVPYRFWRYPGVIGNNTQHLQVRCAGAKALLLNVAFQEDRPWTESIPDTVFTWTRIEEPYEPDYLQRNWPFGMQDEFYDTNVTSRPIDESFQSLPDGSPTIVPMWHAYTRYDWILDRALAHGDSDFPGYIDVSSQVYCGSWTIDPDTGRTRLDGVPLGVLSRKHIHTKPSGRPDVLWGFDPHRFDHESMAVAIRSVLSGVFGLDVGGMVSNENPPPVEPVAATRLHPCRPNPFNPSTMVSFELALPGRAAVTVHDARGSRVSALLDEALPAGPHLIEWRGRDTAGQPVAAGVYFVRLVTDEGASVTRAVLVK